LADGRAAPACSPPDRKRTRRPRAVPPSSARSHRTLPILQRPFADRAAVADALALVTLMRLPADAESFKIAPQARGRQSDGEKSRGFQTLYLGARSAVLGCLIHVHAATRIRANPGARGARWCVSQNPAPVVNATPRGQSRKRSYACSTASATANIRRLVGVSSSSLHIRTPNELPQDTPVTCPPGL
jgi:hypothetical protein